MKAQFRHGPISRNFLEPRSNPRLGRNSRSRTCPRRRSTSIRHAEKNGGHRYSCRVPSHPPVAWSTRYRRGIVAASGWEPKIANFVPSKDFQEYAEQRGMPVWQAYRYRDIAVILPFDSAKRSLGREWKFAPARDRSLMAEITLDHYEDASGILIDVRLERLTPKLAQLLRVAAAVSPSVQGPPHVFLRERFRTIVYLRHLFEQGRLKAIANRPNDPAGKVMSVYDWGGLEIAVGGDHERLSVWMRGKVGTTALAPSRTCGSRGMKFFANSLSNRRRTKMSGPRQSRTNRFESWSVVYARRAAATSVRKKAQDSFADSSPTWGAIVRDVW
jgi:hypothetical protein